MEANSSSVCVLVGTTGTPTCLPFALSSCCSFQWMLILLPALVLKGSVTFWWQSSACRIGGQVIRLFLALCTCVVRAGWSVLELSGYLGPCTLLSFLNSVALVSDENSRTNEILGQKESLLKRDVLRAWILAVYC